MHLTSPSGESTNSRARRKKNDIDWIFVRGTVLLSAPAVQSAPGEFNVSMHSASLPTLPHGDSGRLAAHLPGPQLFFVIGEIQRRELAASALKSLALANRRAFILKTCKTRQKEERKWRPI